MLNSPMRNKKILRNLEEAVFELEPKPIPADSITGAKLSTMMLNPKQLENQARSKKTGRIKDVALEATRIDEVTRENIQCGEG